MANTPVIDLATPHALAEMSGANAEALYREWLRQQEEKKAANANAQADVDARLRAGAARASGESGTPPVDNNAGRYSVTRTGPRPVAAGPEGYGTGETIDDLKKYFGIREEFGDVIYYDQASQQYRKKKDADKRLDEHFRKKKEHEERVRAEDIKQEEFSTAEKSERVTTQVGRTSESGARQKATEGKFELSKEESKQRIEIRKKRDNESEEDHTARVARKELEWESQDKILAARVNVAETNKRIAQEKESFSKDYNAAKMKYQKYLQSGAKNRAVSARLKREQDEAEAKLAQNKIQYEENIRAEYEVDLDENNQEIAQIEDKLAGLDSQNQLDIDEMRGITSSLNRMIPGSQEHIEAMQRISELQQGKQLRDDLVNSELQRQMKIELDNHKLNQLLAGVPEKRILDAQNAEEKLNFTTESNPMKLRYISDQASKMHNDLFRSELNVAVTAKRLTDMLKAAEGSEELHAKIGLALRVFTALSNSINPMSSGLSKEQRDDAKQVIANLLKELKPDLALAGLTSDNEEDDEEEDLEEGE